MSTTPTVRLWAAALLCLATAALGQEPAAETPADQVELDPIRCWWRTEKAAVRVGEPFGLVLTCSVVETRAIRVVPQIAELEPAAIALIPFEVVGGQRHEDFSEGPWRYFQFEYSVRLMAEDLFGQDVTVPSVPVAYNIQSMADGGAEGMDRTYLLPALPIRVHSLVPADADDIRDAPSWTFADMEARRFRASLTMTVAWVVFGFAALLVVLALLRGVGQLRARTPVVRTASLGRVLNACSREMSALQAASRSEGWSPALVARALSVFRIAGAVAIDRPVAQTLVARDVDAETGQLLVRAGLLRPRRVLVSASTTPRDIDGAQARARGKLATILEDIEASLVDLASARYQREAPLDDLVLDQRLADGAGLLRRLRSLRRRPGRSVAGWLRTAMGGAAR